MHSNRRERVPKTRTMLRLERTMNLFGGRGRGRGRGREGEGGGEREGGRERTINFLCH